MKPITEKQRQYAYEHCFEPFAKKTAKGVYTCSDCAHSWEGNLSYTPCYVTCPKCGRKLKVKTDRKKILNDKAYFTVITTVKGYQVLRHFVTFASYRVGEKVSFSITEVVQCRGKCNMNSTFHEDILRVMNKNIYRIEQRMCS